MNYNEYYRIIFPLNNVNGLINGFYIVNHDDIVVVKDHSVVNLFQDGTPHAVIEWKEE